MFCEVELISGPYRGGGGGWQLLYPVVFLLWLGEGIYWYKYKRGRGSIGTSIKGEELGPDFYRGPEVVEA